MDVEAARTLGGALDVVRQRLVRVDPRAADEAQDRANGDVAAPVGGSGIRASPISPVSERSRPACAAAVAASASARVMPFVGMGMQSTRLRAGRRSMSAAGRPAAARSAGADSGSGIVNFSPLAAV